MSTTAQDQAAPAASSAQPDSEETREWVDAIEGVIEHEGPARAQELIGAVVEAAQRGGAHVSLGLSTPYVNTIPTSQQEPMPGNDELETRIRHYVRWNAMAMVARANKESSELGGHVASFASAATLYDVGFNYFFRAPSDQSGGDLVYFQGHSAPGFYARAFIEGRITAEQLENFRREVDGQGLSSYPHPWLMPDFWQFPTVSMGLGPIMSIYQARFMHYMNDRGIIDAGDRKVWAFLGDGEMDEPESMGAITLAAREKLDNLIWVVNCNLQRLDGPVRGNGKIIQELETAFKGAGWNVIKVIWGSNWDPLLERDDSGKLIQVMTECVDGDYQTFKANNGRYVRDKFFGRYPETAELVAHISDDDIWALQRGGHDPRKVYAAYAAAVAHKGQPTVILAKTIKGYGMGESGEAQNIAHQAKKMKVESMRAFRDRFHLPIPDDQVEQLPFFRPAENTPEMKYLRELVKRRGYIPSRRTKAEALDVPPLSAFEAQLKSTGERFITTTSHVESALIDLGIVLIVVFSFRFVHLRVDRAVDNLLFRKRHEDEAALRRFEENAHFYTDAPSLLRDALEVVKKRCEVRKAAIYLRSAGGLEPAVSSFGDPSAVDMNDAALVDVRAHRAVLDLTEMHTRVPGIRLYPMLVAADLAGFLTVGEREGFEEMPADIDRALTALVTSLAHSLHALQHAEKEAEIALLRDQLAAVSLKGIQAQFG